ncbi:MAG: DUF1735 domain-containing protein [Alistipes sp.]|nr:DUF1735 domain-containing protein [Alistipes sp.]
MKKILKYLLICTACTAAWSCYDDFVFDYEYSSVGFALQRPLRTLVADRDMEIFVGVYIGGKRENDMTDYAKFVIDEDLLIGTGLTLLPETHYVIGSPDTFTVRKQNLPVADVSLKFTEDFYNDPNALDQTYYALPLRITSHSLDSITDGLDYSIVAFKYISYFSGTYYVRGHKTYDTLDEDGNPVTVTESYYNKDLSQNITRQLENLSRYSLRRPGLANSGTTTPNKTQLVMTFEPGDWTGETYNVIVETGTHANSFPISNASGTYYPNEERPRIELVYTYLDRDTGITYHVEEELILRRDPVDDLRVDTW